MNGHSKRPHAIFNVGLSYELRTIASQKFALEIQVIIFFAGEANENFRC